MDREIVFIGTSHIDPEGYQRLFENLHFFKPRVILLEVSRFALFFRKTVGIVYKKILHKRIQKYGLKINSELRGIIGYFSVPYEYAAARRFADDTGASVFLVDISLFSLIRLISSHTLLKRKNLIMLSNAIEDGFLKEEKIAERIFIDGDQFLIDMKMSGFERDKLLMRREKLLIKRVSGYIARYGNKGVAYVGGWEHLINDPGLRTLYSNINSSKTRKIIFLKPKRGLRKNSPS